MKRPTWVIIIGIMGIVFGCLGILSAGQDILMPKILKMQKEMFVNIQQFAEEDPDQDSSFPAKTFESMQSMWDVPE